MRSALAKPSPLGMRLLVLALGDLLLLGYIFYCTQLRGQGSFLQELSGFGPNAAPRLLGALALTGIIFTGAIDLSVGAILAVAGTVFGILYHYHASPAVCFAACVLTAWALTAWNGLLVRVLRIPAIIVTLGGLTFYRGVALVASDLCIPAYSEQISVQGDAYHLPGTHWAGWILLAALVVAVVAEHKSKWPRLWLALGCSPDACRLKGLSAGGILQSAFLCGGAFLGLAALTETCNNLTIEPARLGLNFELMAIGAVVLGGTNIFGGEGSYLGTALGGVFLYFVGKALLYAGVSPNWHSAVQGALILLVIGFDCALHRQRRRLEELR
jgi:simple sugar transport system permease protein